MVREHFRHHTLFFKGRERMEEKQKFTAQYMENVVMTNNRLRVSESFDLVSRQIKIGSKSAMLYFIDGFIKDDLMEKIMSFMMGATDEKLSGLNTARDFADAFVPYVETEVVSDLDSFETYVFSGALGMVLEGYRDAVIIDARTYPARSVGEPENDKVLRGSHDGFVETLIFNTALIRRRVRDTNLTMQIMQIGKKSKTDVVLCYLDGVADEEEVKKLKKKLSQIEVNALTMGHESLAECLVPKQRFNPFPKVRYTERPDSAAASIYEGSMLVLTDNSPSVMIIPTGIFYLLQDTNDYYFPSLIGSYLRIVRIIVFFLTLMLTPVWYLLIENPEFIPAWLDFIKIEDPTMVPVIVQLLIIEVIIDALKLASLNTPNALSNSFSVIGALVLGEFAISAKWFVAEVVLYMAFVAITNFAQPSYELGYAFKLCRMMLLILTAIFNLWGFIGGLVLIVLMIAFNKTVTGRCYLYPLIPFDFKALTSLLLRKPLQRSKN